MLSLQDLAHFPLGIVAHPTAVIEHHRLGARWFEWLPSQAGLAGIARAREIGPGRSHLLCQRLCFRPVAGSLFAALRVVKAEGKLRRMPRTGIFQHGRLSGEIPREHRRALLVAFHRGHTGNVVAYMDAV
jgi:hypothetical protein